MYPLPDNNFNRIALFLTDNPKRVSATDFGSRLQKGARVSYAKPGSNRVSYAYAKTLGDGRVLDVEFNDAFSIDEYVHKSYSTLEIKIEPSDPNSTGFHTTELSVVNFIGIRERGRERGLYFLLREIGMHTSLRTFRQYNGREAWVEYAFPMSSGSTRTKFVKTEGKNPIQNVPMAPDEVHQITSKYKRLGDEVLAVLKGESDNITVS